MNEFKRLEVAWTAVRHHFSVGCSVCMELGAPRRPEIVNSSKMNLPPAPFSGLHIIDRILGILRQPIESTSPSTPA